LLQAGSSLTATGTDDWTPLHLAAASSSPAMLKLLVEAGAEVDALSICGDTPLHLCVTSCNVESAKTLLDAGAIPDVENHKGVTPLMSAQNDGCTAIAELIQRYTTKQ
jgi:ankyrin repeat protein